VALALQQYVAYLDHRGTPWPAPPVVKSRQAKPYLAPLPYVRAVLWNVYGTLLAISEGELLFVHPSDFVMEVALDKTIQEFKMWASMSRKPGQPADYLRQIYLNLLDEQRLVPGNLEKHPEVAADRLWESFIKMLFQKDYTFDAGFYGSLNEFSRKVAYFFHASLQGTECYPGAAEALRYVAQARLVQGFLANGQCFTPAQLQRGLSMQDATVDLDRWIDPTMRFLSHDVRARKPSERLFRPCLAALAEKGIAPDQVLHVGSRIRHDLTPARRFGMKTALFAGDNASLEARNQQLKDPSTRPDVLLTDLAQIAEVVG
jgi:phosphoglycolate phosphatase-like HAD superfamily hydrolase